MEKISEGQEWFETWFDSPYYHILYRHRDIDEAASFIDGIFNLLTPDREANILDLACGRGRHAVYMNSKGYHVTGLDLSMQSVAYAQQFENENLSFFQHDMRNTFRTNYFDFVFNLFTSFGYFETESDNQKAMRSITSNLKKDGFLVLDYMNVCKVSRNLKGEEVQVENGIEFHIKRSVLGGFIIKNIFFEIEGKEFHFFEKVEKLLLSDFQKYFHRCGLNIVHLFGNYKLEPFDQHHSPRLIMVAQKKVF